MLKTDVSRVTCVETDTIHSSSAVQKTEYATQAVQCLPECIRGVFSFLTIRVLHFILFLRRHSRKAAVSYNI